MFFLTAIFLLLSAEASVFRDCGAALTAQAARISSRQNQFSNPALYDVRAVREGLQKVFDARPPHIRDIPTVNGDTTEKFSEWQMLNLHPTDEEWKFHALMANINELKILETDLTSTSAKHVAHMIQIRGNAEIQAYLEDLQIAYTDIADEAVRRHTPWVRPMLSSNPLALLAGWLRNDLPDRSRIEAFAFVYEDAVNPSRRAIDLANELNHYWISRDVTKAYQRLALGVSHEFYYAFFGDFFLARLNYDPVPKNGEPAFSKDQFLAGRRLDAMIHELNLRREDLIYLLNEPVTPKSVAEQQLNPRTMIDFDFIASFEGGAPILYVVMRVERPNYHARPGKRKVRTYAEQNDENWSGAANPVGAR